MVSGKRDNPRVSLDPESTRRLRRMGCRHGAHLTVELVGGEVWQLHFGAKNPTAVGYARAEQVK